MNSYNFSIKIKKSSYYRLIKGLILHYIWSEQTFKVSLFVFPKILHGKDQSSIKGFLLKEKDFPLTFLVPLKTSFLNISVSSIGYSKFHFKKFDNLPIVPSFLDIVLSVVLSTSVE